MSLYLSCSDAVSVPFICCKARLVTEDLNYVCFHPKYTTIIVTINDINVVIKRKISII